MMFFARFSDRRSFEREVPSGEAVPVTRMLFTRTSVSRCKDSTCEAKSSQAHPVVPIGRLQKRIPLPEINLNAEGIGMRRLLSPKSPEEQHRY